MRHALIALAATLCACATPTPPTQVAPDRFTVSVHWLGSIKEIQSVARDYGQLGTTGGFAVMARKGEDYHCDVYVVQPDRLTATAQELLGHEFAHCLFGAWHP